MTQQVELMKKIDKLPSQYLSEVFDFVEYLQYKAHNGYKTLDTPTKEKSEGRRGFGCAKGQIWIADDFNEPLEDFKDYM